MFTRRAWRGLAPNSSGLIETATYIWNTNTLAWEAASGVAGVGAVTVTNFPVTQPVSGTVTANTGLSQPVTDVQIRATPLPVSGTFFQATQPVSGPLTDGQLRTSPISTLAELYATKVDEASETVTYVGRASVGTGGGPALWQIQRITISGSLLTTEYADGNSSFDNIWNNRAALSYS